MTALELAQHLGVKHQIELLRPVIRVPIPTSTLNALQEQFHELIRRDMGDAFRDEEWCLPQLEVLLEFEPRQWTWFPTHGSGARVAVSVCYLRDWSGYL